MSDAAGTQSSSILIDDTRGPIGRWAYDTFRKDMQTVWELKINRKGALNWVQNLRYLAYDDESDSDNDDEENSESWREFEVDENCITSHDIEVGLCMALQSPDEVRNRAELMEDYAEYLQRTQPDNEALDMLPEPVPPVGETISNPEVSDDEIRVDETEFVEDSRSCGFCEPMPWFPRKKRPNKFRLIQFSYDEAVAGESNLKQCIHYAAVSYCWPKDAKGNATVSAGTYCVREILADGTVVERRTRAPDEIMDRAVAFAREEGLRLIWIDQECIQRDIEEEQNVGIQAMDLVYHQAVSTVGILQQCRISAAQVHVLSMIMDWYETDIDVTAFESFILPRDFPILKVGQELVSFLSSFISDPWNSRAWILQEMFAAGEDAELSIQCVPDLTWFPQGCEMEDTSSQRWDLVTTTIKLKTMQEILQACKTFFSCIFATVSVSAEEQHIAQSAEALSIMEAFGKILRKLDDFHPERVAFQDLSSRITMDGGASLGTRRKCNASVALTYLKSRDNTRPADRLAILANICEYEVRLDLIKVERRVQSLTTCTVALALMNGDFSLMPSEIYQFIPPKESPTGLPRWAMRFHELLPSIEHRPLKPGENISLRDPRRYVLDAHGFTIPGYLWTIDRSIDVTALQTRCMEDWLQLSEYRRMFEPLQQQHYAHAEQCQSCKSKIHLTMSHRRLLEQVLADHSTNCQRFDSNGDIANDANTCLSETLGLRTFVVQQSAWFPSLAAMASMFWEVLWYLHYEVKETALANSLWHSIRQAHFHGVYDDDGDDDEEVLREGETGYRELPDEVEKILEKGKNYFQPLRSLFQIDSSIEYFWNQYWILERVMTDGTLWIGRYHLPMNSWPRAEMRDDREQQQALEPMQSRILSRQSVNQFLACAARVSTTAADDDTSISIGNYITLIEALSGNLWTREYEQRRSERVSLFDVDGPCSVFSPYDSDVERLPRPNCRSLSWSWVVEEEKEAGKRDEKLPPSDSDDANIVPGKDSLSLASMGTMNDADSSFTSQQNKFDEAELRYIAKLRVLDSVKGAWQCMEIPHQTYLFV